MKRIATIGVACLLPVVGQSAEIQVFSDDMSGGAAAYDSSFLSFDDSDGNLSIEVLDSPFSGNPDDRLEVLHFHDPVDAPEGNPDGYDIQSFHTYTLVSWDPSIDGEIVDVSFSIDVEHASGNLTLFFEMAQGGGGSFAGFTDIASTSGYETVSVSNLGPADFGGIDFAGGGPITFGFGMLSYSFGFGDTEFFGEQFAASFDNFEVTVQVVPLPGALWLFAGGLAGLVGLRQRS